MADKTTVILICPRCQGAGCGNCEGAGLVKVTPAQVSSQIDILRDYVKELKAQIETNCLREVTNDPH